MNKKLIAVAIAAAVAAPAAMAGDTTLYGKVHVSIDSFDNDADGTDNMQVNDRGSRLGVKGSEDLGNGLKAIFKYEMSYDVDGGAAITGARNSYLGLAGDFGTLLVGRHDSPAKVAFYATGAELLGDSVVQLTSSNETGGMLNIEETRANNAIAYVSPSFSGVTAAVAIMPGEGSAATGNDGLADGWSAGVMYKGHGLKAGLGYEDTDDLGGTNTGMTLYNIGATYSIDAFTFGGVYQNQEAAAGGAESDMYALVGKAKFGNNEIMALYGKTENNAAQAAASLAANGAGYGGREGDAFGIAVAHKMSKRTKVYAAYASKDVDGAATGMASVGSNEYGQGGEFSLGMIHKF